MGFLREIDISAPWDNHHSHIYFEMYLTNISSFPVSSMAECCSLKLAGMGSILLHFFLIGFRSKLEFSDMVCTIAL